MSYNSIFPPIFILRARVGPVPEPRHNLGHVGACLLAIGGGASAKFPRVWGFFRTLPTLVHH